MTTSTSTSVGRYDYKYALPPLPGKSAAMEGSCIGATMGGRRHGVLCIDPCGPAADHLLSDLLGALAPELTIVSTRPSKRGRSTRTAGHAGNGWPGTTREATARWLLNEG